MCNEPHIPSKLLRGQKGISILAIIFVIMVLTAVGYTFSAMIAAKQESVPLTVHGGKAFYIAEGGIDFAARYLSGLGSGSWSGPPPNQSRNLGGGSFTVVFTNYASVGGVESVDATATGTYGIATRVLVTTFSRRL
jgi:hypothetical protein